MCYAPFACKEDKPCPSRTFLTCACQNRKTEVKCGATRLGSSPEQREQLKCNDECLRLERNRRLADALKIDQDTVDDFIPYSDTTLKLFRETGATWAQDQEREFRVFASDAAERRLRFKPMQPQQRAFVHSLAEDFGLDSESQDPAPHRHVVVFKTPRFVSAPRKTLAQCARVAKTAATLGTTVSSTPATNPRPRPSREAAYNALLLLQSRFGMTIEDVDAALMPELAAASRTLQFVTDFLPTGEVVVRAIPPPVTAASIATAGAASTPQAVEACLARIQPAVDRAAVTFKVAAAVVLCHIDDALHITRRDDGSGSGSGSGPGNTGWNAVVGRGSWRKGGGGAVAKPPERKVLSGFLALRKAEPESQPRPEKKKDEPVDEDWLAAAEKEEQEEQRVGAAEAEKSRGWGSK